MKTLLLNPGPVTLTERVRRSLLQPDLCHRESEFYDLQDEARSRLLDVYGLDSANWSAVLMTASGTGAVESMIASLVPAEGKLLVVQNGVYGERIANIAKQYGIAHETIAHDWMSAPDLDQIAERLQSNARAPFTHVAVVHHETTTGRLNDLQALGTLCRAHDAQLLVDAVSSFGAESIDFDGANIAAAAATANKCLHGVPGASFVIASREAIERAASRTYYLDLARLARMQAQRNTPFTPSVHAYYALVEALREFEDEGGVSARHARYAALAEQVRSGLAARGIASIVPPEQSSVVLRSYALPSGIAYEPLHDALKAHGFVIYAGQGDLSKRLFRISTMGDLSSADIERLLQAFDALVR
ncbi:MAG TPA: 2-aminoethylphosphonate aminotransferase [Trinickia sp.]